MLYNSTILDIYFMELFKDLILGSELGDACVRVREKCWILPAAMAAVSVGSSIFGGSKSASANAEQRKFQNDQRASNNAWYKFQKNMKYADTSSGRRTMDVSRGVLESQNKQTAGTSAVGGASTAAVAAAKEKMNNAIANTAANLASVDTQRQMNADTAHRQDERSYYTGMANLEAQRQQNIATAASQASNGLISAASTLDKSIDKKNA